MKHLTYNQREVNDREYKIYLEGMAYGIWKSRIASGKDDGYHKSCDPLMFDLDEPKSKEVYSYVFDLWDGGRHHEYETLEQIEEALLREIEISYNPK